MVLQSEKTGKEIRLRVRNGERGSKIIAAIYKGQGSRRFETADERG